MPKFTVHHAAFQTALTLKTIGRIVTTTTVKAELVYLAITGSGSVAPNATDLQHEFGASWLTNAGVGSMTPYTAEPADQTSNIARCGYSVNATGEPTAYSTNPFLFGGFNQRIGFTFGMPEGQGFTALPAAPSFKHMGVRVRSSLAHFVDFNAHIIEP